MRCWGVGEVSAYQSCVQFSGVTPVGPTTRRDTGYALVRGLLQTFHKSLLSILEEAGNGFFELRSSRRLRSVYFTGLSNSSREQGLDTKA